MVVAATGTAYALGAALATSSLVTSNIPSRTALTLASHPARWSLPTVVTASGTAWGLGEALEAAPSGFVADGYADGPVLWGASGVMLVALVTTRGISRSAGETVGFAPPRLPAGPIMADRWPGAPSLGTVARMEDDVE